MILLILLYTALGYWSTGKTIYANKILIGTEQAIWGKRITWGVLFGWILIPIAILKTLTGH